MPGAHRQSELRHRADLRNDLMLRAMIEERYIGTPSKQRQRTGNRHASTLFAANLRSAGLTADRLFRSRSSAWVKSNRAAIADEGQKHRLCVSSTVMDLPRPQTHNSILTHRRKESPGRYFLTETGHQESTQPTSRCRKPKPNVPVRRAEGKYAHPFAA